MDVKLGAGDALVIVDMQNDFMPMGSLPVPEGETIIPVINRYLDLFHNHGLLIFATRDWHPPDHCSFLHQGGPWPAHCIATTTGAAFHPDIEFPINTQIISKATSQEKDAYSAFTDTQFNMLLKASGVRRLFIGGVAMEICVLNTVKDALQYHYTAYVLEDATRAIKSDDGSRAWEEIIGLGAKPIQFKGIAA